ncbi:hypothetical protein FTO70_10885 [Methanosarcina sp. KYL-1]|uniref:hypothetical protein n=1 Tax=Methanosarcina sp. KYL-1 TaxID=2602068 RepID=UPI0021007F4B|nr:hypothetical protein [Methanosarcina sp. KYL-1]MCQ1536175.1 hypothetical protein [Methanosarcina sp. KYL-1]
MPGGIPSKFKREFKTEVKWQKNRIKNGTKNGLNKRIKKTKLRKSLHPLKEVKKNISESNGRPRKACGSAVRPLRDLLRKKDQGPAKPPKSSSHAPP